VGVAGRVNTKQAKDFLVDQTVRQAASEGVQLSDVEKRMMYFTESDTDSCENPIQLNNEFETQNETREYETKISKLLHDAHKRLKKENLEQARNWDQAVRTLRKGDHYLLVMLDQSSASGIGGWMPFLRGIGIGVLICVLIFVEISLEEKGLIPKWLFGWFSNDPQTQKLKFSLILYGCVGLWFILKLARLGALRDVTKTLLSTFSFLRPKGPSRR
jgi:hypothetical protein